MALDLLARLSPPRGDRRSQQGLSLIECLVAIVIVSLTVLAITPPILLGAATRVQSRRSDQANHIAQSEIDRIRTLVERGNYTLNDLPASGGTNNLSAIGVATTSPVSGPLLSPGNCGATPPRYPAATPLPLASLAQVDIDGDCRPEYMMQVFRTAGYTPSPSDATTPPYSFVMGVRIYAYNPGESLPTLTKERASMIMGTGARDRRAGNQRQPLAVLYSQVARNDQGQSLGQLCNQARNNPTGCNF